MNCHVIKCLILHNCMYLPVANVQRTFACSKNMNIQSVCTWLIYDPRAPKLIYGKFHLFSRKNDSQGQLQFVCNTKVHFFFSFHQFLYCSHCVEKNTAWLLKKWCVKIFFVSNAKARKIESFPVRLPDEKGGIGDWKLSTLQTKKRCRTCQRKKKLNWK